MSKTLTAADTYIAKILGGSGDDGIKAQARDALQSAFEELLHRNNWRYLQVDTSRSFTVANATITANTILTTTVTDGFKDVLVGMTITGTGIPADTTVASITSSEIIVVSATSTSSGVTVTLGGTIPIIAGTDEYALPTAFWKPLSCRLTSSRYVKLSFITVEEWDAISGDQTNQGTTQAYTIYSGGRIFDASGFQRDYIRFIRPPGANDICLFKYYRTPVFSSTDSDPVDVPDEFLYIFLDLAQIHLLMKKDAHSRKIPALMGLLEPRIARAISTDRNPGGDDQMESFLTPNQTDGQGFDGNIWPKNYLGRG